MPHPHNANGLGLEQQCVGVDLYPRRKPAKVRGLLSPFRVVSQVLFTLEIVGTKQDPDAPDEWIVFASHWNLDAPAYEVVFAA